MDILLAIVAIISVVVRLVAESKKREEQQAQKTAASDPKGEAGRKPTGERRYGGVNRPNAEGYRQESKAPERNIESTFRSTEGSESTEGECIEPNADHCSVEHSEDSVYATEITDEPASAFTKEDMVKGIIMAEILSKPKWME